MKRAYYIVPLLTATLTVSSSSSLHAAQTPADPDVTRQALAMLMAAANEPVPKSSSCQGDYGQEGVVKVKDVLAMEFAYLYNGANVIEARCDAKKCMLSITHDAGEVVSSADISFKIAGKKAVISSLECMITP